MNKMYMLYLIVLTTAIAVFAGPSKLEKKIQGSWNFLTFIDHGQAKDSENRSITFDYGTAIYTYQYGDNDTLKYTLEGDSLFVGDYLRVRLVLKKDVLFLNNEEQQMRLSLMRPKKSSKSNKPSHSYRKYSKKIVGDWKVLSVTSHGTNSYAPEQRNFWMRFTTDSIFHYEAESLARNPDKYVLKGNVISYDDTKGEILIQNDTLILTDNDVYGDTVMYTLVQPRKSVNKSSRLFRKYPKKIIGDWRVLFVRSAGEQVALPEGTSMEFQFSTNSWVILKNHVQQCTLMYTITDNQLIAGNNHYDFSFEGGDYQNEVSFKEDTLCMIKLDGSVEVMYLVPTTTTTSDIKKGSEGPTARNSAKDVNSAINTVRSLLMSLEVYEAEMGEYSDDVSQLGVDTSSEIWEYRITLSDTTLQVKAIVKPNVTVGKIASGEYFAMSGNSEKMYSHAEFPTYSPLFFDDASLVK